MGLNFFKFKANFLGGKKSKKVDNVVGLKYRATFSEFQTLPTAQASSNYNGKQSLSKNNAIKDRQPTSEQSFDTGLIRKPEPPEIVINPSPSVTTPEPPRSILKKPSYNKLEEIGTSGLDENDTKAALIFMTESHDSTTIDNSTNAQKYSTHVSDEEILGIKGTTVDNSVNTNTIETYSTQIPDKEIFEIKDNQRLEEITLDEEQVEFNNLQENEDQIEVINNLDEEQVELHEYNHNQSEVDERPQVMFEEQVEVSNNEQIEVTSNEKMSNYEQIEITNDEQIEDEEDEQTEVLEHERHNLIESSGKHDEQIEVLEQETHNKIERSDDDLEYKVHIAKQISRESEIESEDSEEEDEADYVNRDAYSSQAASIFFAGEEPQSVIREKKIQETRKDGESTKVKEQYLNF